VGLSESEIEARLAALRRQREALDREIADLVLYLELGRRLGVGGTGDRARTEPVARAGPDDRTDPVPEPGRTPDRAPVPRPDPAAAPVARGQVPAPVRVAGPSAAAHPGPPSATRSDARPEPRPEIPWPAGAIPPAVAFTEDAAGARRYGRAVVQAACAAIAQAGRPLHAAEILEVLLRHGFTLPGRDPVAALNTRLWKRAGPDGPLRRVGEATYALAPGDPEPV
jgi:HB1, ASXL, restriction endonuclease HTH domain